MIRLFYKNYSLTYYFQFKSDSRYSMKSRISLRSAGSEVSIKKLSDNYEYYIFDRQRVVAEKHSGRAQFSNKDYSEFVRVCYFYLIIRLFHRCVNWKMIMSIYFLALYSTRNQHFCQFGNTVNAVVSAMLFRADHLLSMHFLYFRLLKISHL
jgi:hypothetical protein